jgi:hypothetical protein
MAGWLIETGALIAMSGEPSRRDRDFILKTDRAGSWMGSAKPSTEIAADVCEAVGPAIFA